MHELGHARYLVDAYRLDPGSRRGDLSLMNPAPPEDANGHVHRTQLRGLARSR
jgi:hypothetical protein